MKISPITLVAMLLMTWFCGETSAADAPIAIAIHGGAGTLLRQDMDEAREAAFRAALREAVQSGHAVLDGGGSSLEAVRTAIRLLEDSPLFNAGRGAVFNADGVNELDASIMDGATRKAGAVAAVHRVKNPIDLAMKVMSDSPHVLLIGDGAERFAAEQGIELVDPAWFRTDHRWKELQEAKAKESAGLPASTHLWSTVGAVALDRAGNLAAGTSTGGMVNKRYGRVGDSPIIGAGTFADNASCAVSATGHGEYFIRWVVAYDICQRVAQGNSIDAAASAVVHGVLREVGGEGGVIGMDARGNIAMPFNTEGMYRASIDVEGRVSVAIYGDE